MKHKYKPKEDWNITGFLCGDCHIEKTKEFALREQEEKAAFTESCMICKKKLVRDDEKRKPRWQWNLDAESGEYVCSKCFEKADADYNKKLNFCTMCNKKLGFIRYNPKPEWNLKGQLCRICWDVENQKKRKDA